MSDIQAPFVAGTFDDPREFMKAAEASTARGHANHDAVMPYPVHGFDHVMGFKRSWIGRIVLFMLITGAFVGFFMQYWMMKENWPINIAGKPYNSWPAFVVITFEMGILSGALTNMFCCIVVACKLRPEPAPQVINEDFTDDTFALCIPLEGNGSFEEIKGFLADQGAADIALYDYQPDATTDSDSDEAHARAQMSEGGHHA